MADDDRLRGNYDDPEVTPDNALERTRDGDAAKEQVIDEQGKQPNDFDTPASPSDAPHRRSIPPDYQSTDTAMEFTEQYQDGTAAAAGIDEHHETDEYKNRALYDENDEQAA